MCANTSQITWVDTMGWEGPSNLLSFGCVVCVYAAKEGGDKMMSFFPVYPRVPSDSKNHPLNLQTEVTRRGH